jgi:subtilisin family serine protease
MTSKRVFSSLRPLAILWAACVLARVVCGAESIQPLGTSSLSPPNGPTLYSMAGGLKLPAASPGGAANLLYLQGPSISGTVSSGVFSGQTALNSPAAPAPLPVAAPGVPATPITAHSSIYDVAAYDPDTGDITWGNFINDVVGATAFYATGVLDDQNPGNVIGIFGQDTYVADIDAGHPFAGPNGAGTLAGVNVSDPNMYYSPTDSQGNSLVVTAPQAHATEVCMTIAGGGSELLSATGTTTVRAGIAPLTNLCTGAIATSTSSDGSFSITAQTYLSTFSHFANATWTRNIAYPTNVPGVSVQYAVTGPTDVINASFGITPDTAGTLPETIAVDALAEASPQTTFVIAAGNSGPASNTLGGPASGYNVIAVGAADELTTPGTTTVASFSSRGPQDFAGDPNGPNPVVAGVRAPVDLVAPGVNLLLATYDGNPADTEVGVIASGTSFAAPIVASGVSLLDSLSYHLAYTVEFSTSAENFANSRDSRVVKAVLMNSATKLPGWNNGQYTSGGVTYTEQALDMSQGAGMLNMAQAEWQYLGGTLDPFGVAGPVQPTGWSLATVASGGHTDYTIDTQLPGGSYLDATLCWFRDRALPAVDPTTGDWAAASTLASTDLGMAKLDLQIWDSTFTTLYAESDTSYNDVQELHFLLPADGDYGIRVFYESQLFGTPDAGGETFGLAWNDSLVAVPEPSTLACLAAAAIGLLVARKRKRLSGFSRLFF